MNMTANGKRRERRSVVLIETSVGNIRVALSDDTPMHRNNFLRLVSKGYYDGTLFHRVIENFMIQGGDPDSKDAAPGVELGNGEPDYRIPAEFDLPFLYHWRGALAAARESDEYNPERESSGSQFYIVWGKKQKASDIRKVTDMLEEKGIKLTSHMIDEYMTRGGTPHLDGQYTVFGEVIEGLEVVGKIQGVKTDKNDRPIEDVRVIRMTVERLSSKARRPTRPSR
ncbi:MAG: peptidylprolyl isomerase [Bacteroidaceae bacterium]